MINKASFRLNQWVEYLLFTLGFSMTALVAVQVFCRYVLNESLFWSEELSRFFLVWLTFLGASCAYYHKVNPGVDFLYIKMSASLQKNLIPGNPPGIHCTFSGHDYLWIPVCLFRPPSDIPRTSNT